ncbi:MAG: ketoacyl-ACP synthase III [Alphaproteobacteria bacterium]|nr:ketoacyl-ACP synthase III [Alphaproteobacteria bacterium]
MRQAHIVGTGSYLPPRVVTNDDLTRVYGIASDDRWIRTRTGVEQRRFADEGVGTAELGAHAARAALDDAGLDARQIDQIVFCTLSPDKAFPGSGVYLQAMLGIPDDEATFTPCLDVRAQCSGFLYGLHHATAVVRAGMAERVLVVGAEVHSAALDLTTRGRTVASLFGDGAGAVVVGATDDDRGVRDIVLGADGRHADDLSQGVWDMRRRPFVPLDAEGNGRIPPEQLWATMHGQLVFKHAVQRMVDVVNDLCRRNRCAPLDIDLFLFHQANLRIVHAVQNLLELPDDRVLNNIQRYGNTTAATIPLLLDEAVRTGRLTRGMRVATVVFGSGFTWGGALLDW